MTGDPSATPEPLSGPALADAYLEHLRLGGQETPEAYLARKGAVSEDALELLRIVSHFADEEPFTLHAGQVLGSYRIETQLGSGGMGTVYLATVEEATAGLEVDTRVALKVIHPHLLSRPGFFKRFLREADVGKRLHHDNVVQVLDVDATEVEAWVTHYLAMEYVEGRTLRELLQTSGPVSEGLLREVARQAASGLEAIHAAGIVHRDIKPENVLITDDHRVRIMDLGVARLVDQTAALTKEGQFAGTVLYAAPEQFGTGEVGPAADLYALGVVLYELASGENPFRRDETAGVVRAHLDEVPMLLADQDADLSAFFSGVVATLLAKDPAERFASAAELSAALEGGERSSWWGEQEKTLRKLKGHLPRVPVRRETRLHGREGDFAVLRDAWQHARDGSGNTLLLYGEAGIGKTRLVDAFLRELDAQSAHVLYGSYPPSGGAGGLTDAIVEHFGSADLETTLRPHLTVTPTLVAPLAALLQHERLPDDAPSLAGDALHAVLVHLMRGLAAEKPLLWVVDDLHFASADSRKVLLSLARAVEGHRVLLLLTSRPGLPKDELAHFARLENFQRTALGRLSPREVIELLRDAFRSEALAEKLGGKIAYKSDGVPFFVFEMIRGLKEGQFITELPDGSYVESKVVEEIEVPSAVRDLIEARLRDLTKEERAILDVASVQGFEFDPDLVARVRKRERIEILETLSDLDRTHGVVRSTGHRFRFDHHQFQEVLYLRLPMPLREEYHTALAEAFAEGAGIATSGSERGRGQAALFLVEHQLSGRAPRTAIPHLESALVHLIESFRNEEAIQLADRALEVVDLLVGKTRVDVLLRKDHCLNLLGRRDLQEAVLAEARRLAALGGERELIAGVESRLGMLASYLDRYDEARAHHECHLAIAREIGDRRGEGVATGNVGGVHLARGRYEEAREYLEGALTVACEVGDRADEMKVRGNLGIMYAGLCQYEESGAYMEQALVIARETGNRQDEVTTLCNLGSRLTRVGRNEEARTQFEQGIVAAREIGDRQGELYATGGLAVALRKLGRLEEAIRHNQQAVLIAREIGSRQCEAIYTATLGDVHDLLGRHEEARVLYGDALVNAREIGNRQIEAAAEASLGLALQSLGRLEESQARMERALAVNREIGDRRSEAIGLMNLGGLWLSLGAQPRARTVLQAALETCREIGARYPEGYAILGLSRAADEAGEITEALDLATQALELRRGIGHEDGVADSLVQVGALHRKTGDPEAARDALEEAVALLREQERWGGLAEALALLANLPDGDPIVAEAALKDAGEAGNTAQTRYYLWQATGKHEHLTEAKRLLDYRVEHAPEEYRESMLKNVRLNREIMEAWAEHGEASTT